MKKQLKNGKYLGKYKKLLFFENNNDIVQFPTAAVTNY